MGQPVVHFEIIGNDPERLRGYYGDLFGWAFDTGGPVAASVSEAGRYGFTQPESGIPGGVGVAHFTDPEGNLIGLAGPA